MDCSGGYLTYTSMKKGIITSLIESYTGIEYDVRLASSVRESDHRAFITLPVS
jgi:hypothetical protein